MYKFLIPIFLQVSLFGDWHSWTEHPFYDQLYAFEVETNEFKPNSKPVVVVSPFLTDGNYLILRDKGWYDFNIDYFAKRHREGHIIIFFPNDRFPDWIK